MTGRGIICLAILIAAPSSVLAQQAIQSLEPGQRVRINGVLEENFVAVSGDSLIVRALSIHLESITRLEVRRARSVRAGAVRGLAWGGGIGAFAGFMLGAAMSAECSGSCLIDPGPGEAVLGAAAIGALGATLGLVIGSWTPGMTWSEIQPSAFRTPTRTRIRVQPTVVNGIGFSASMKTN